MQFHVIHDGLLPITLDISMLISYAMPTSCAYLAIYSLLLMPLISKSLWLSWLLRLDYMIAHKPRCTSI